MPGRETPPGEGLPVSVRYSLIEALQEREHQLAEAQRLAHLGSWSWDLASGVITWSDELFRIFGLRSQEFTPSYEGFMAHVDDGHRPRVEQIVQDAIAARASFDYECPTLGPRGRRWIHARGDVVTDGSGEPVRLHGTVQDITDLVEIRESLAASERHLNALSTAVTEVVFLYEPDGTVRFSTSRLEEALGYPPRSQLEVDPWELVHPDDVVRLRARLARLRREAGSTVTAEFRARHADGSWRSLEARGQNASDDRDIQGTLVTIRDTTELRIALDAVARLSLADPLTGLATRALLELRATRALSRAARHGWTTAVLAIDLDGFRAVNDTFGHEAGDQVLVEVGRRLEQIFRPYDAIARSCDTVARLGGDEFLVLCEQVADVPTAQRLARRVADALRAAFPVPTGEAVLTASIGVALAPADDSQVDELVRRAEVAMRRSKRHGPGSCQVYELNVVGDDVGLASEAVSELRSALDGGQLRLVYQPKVALDTGRTSGAEALLRWEHPERGTVPPLDFIPLAEESGLIVPIGGWVIEEACRQAAAWRDGWPDRPQLVVSVNVSARQFGPDLVDVVSEALAASDLDPGALCLEVTETVLMSDVPAAVATLQALADLGVLVSIDDFGTGYSSLAYLKRLPLDELKIDKTFVDGLGIDPDDTAIVAATIAMAHALGLHVVAEGVETGEQAERLRVLGCEHVQGYHYGRPGPAAALDEVLAAEAAGTWLSHERSAGSHAPSGFRMERVLVIDDTADVRMLARMSLTTAGFDVHEADSGATGLAVARELAPDCVLLDLVMPDMDGFAVCRALREDEVTAGCTILMLTANADAGDKIQAFAAGADDYIIKPFSPRDLTARVRAAIARRGDAS